MFALVAMVGLIASLSIHEAVESNRGKYVKAAIAAGADVNEIGAGGQTPLMHAVLAGKEKAVKALLAAGADTSIGEKDGYTPMHGAAFQGRAAIAKMLIKHGLNPSDMHTDGYTPLHRACWGREARHTDTVWAFLDAGVPPDEPSADGKRPIEMATNNDNTRLLLGEALREKKVADANAKV